MKLNFGKRNDPVLPILRRVLRESRQSAQARCLPNALMVGARTPHGNGTSGSPPSILQGIAPMPALLTASKLTTKAARVGFDWPNIEEIFAKLHEEVDELKEALLEAPAASESSRIEQEVGDLLFVAVNIARFLRIDPETALRKTNQKFVSRFQHIEHRLREAGKDFSQSNLEEMERFWQEAKKEA